MGDVKVSDEVKALVTSLAQEVCLRCMPEGMDGEYELEVLVEHRPEISVVGVFLSGIVIARDFTLVIYTGNEDPILDAVDSLSDELEIQGIPFNSVSTVCFQNPKGVVKRVDIMLNI